MDHIEFLRSLNNVRNLTLRYIYGEMENQMAQVSELKALTNYFNVPPAKVPAKEWMVELKALTAEEKTGLAKLVVAETGDTLAPPKPKA